MLSVVGSRSHQTFHNIISNFILSLPLDTRDSFSLLRYVAINRRLNEKACRSSHERRHQKRARKKLSDWSKSLQLWTVFIITIIFSSRSWLCSGIVLAPLTSARAINSFFRGLSHMLVYARSWWWLGCFFHLFNWRARFTMGERNEIWAISTNELLSKNKQSLINLFIIDSFFTIFTQHAA